MRSEQLEYNESPAALPATCYEALSAPPGDTSASETRASPIGLLTLGIAWLFGLEALLSDDYQ